MTNPFMEGLQCFSKFHITLNLPSVKRIMLTSLTKHIESGIPSPRTMKTSLANSNWAFLYQKMVDII